MNLNTLNLDWILRELKAIKDLAPTEDATLLKMVANALIAETYDTTTQYNVDDIVYRDNEKRLFKCVTATPAGGEPFDSNKWVEVDVGEVLTDLLVNGGTANAVTNVRYNDHKIQQEINGAYSDVIVIEDTPTDVSDRLPSSKAVYNLNGAITALPDDMMEIIPLPNQSNFYLLRFKKLRIQFLLGYNSVPNISTGQQQGAFYTSDSVQFLDYSAAAFVTVYTGVVSQVGSPSNISLYNVTVARTSASGRAMCGANLSGLTLTLGYIIIGTY